MRARFFAGGWAGFADNAEVWNGRVSMMSFVFLCIQVRAF
jgi:hypothetical protein